MFICFPFWINRFKVKFIHSLFHSKTHSINNFKAPMTCQRHISSVADYKWSFQLMSETVSQRNNLVKLKKTTTTTTTQISDTKSCFPSATQSIWKAWNTGSEAPLEMNRRVLRYVKLGHAFTVPSFLHIHFPVTHVNTSTAYMAQTEQNFFLFNRQTNFLMNSQSLMNSQFSYE